MTTYAIGDLHGCAEHLDRLLELIEFSSKADKLCFVGDLTNRGPASLETIRQVKKLNFPESTVLGNHDLYLIGLARLPKLFSRFDHTLDDILNAPDKLEIIEWLRRRPLIHFDKKTNFIVTHAGIFPGWSYSQAFTYANEVSTILRDDKLIDEFLENLFGDNPKDWDNSIEGWDRLRFITNAFTRMRYCDNQMGLNLSEKKGLDGVTKNQIPWFLHKNRVDLRYPIVFGHWSALRMPKSDQTKYNVFPIDTGAVWGGKLTALNLNSLKTFSCDFSNS